MERVEIVRMDDFGRGIAYLNDLIVFIPKSVVGDILDIEITKEYKNYLEGKIISIIKPSSNRIKSICPYFNKCGGCDLLCLNYKDTLNYKLSKIENLIRRNKFDVNVSIIENQKPLNYRNKISLKIVNSKIGYFESKTNTLIEIDSCFIADNSINDFIKDYKLLNIKDGLITIRCNYLNELLIIIESNNPNKIDINSLIKKHNIKGIIYNNKTIYKDNFFYDKIGDYEFKISYNSFFQVNRYITNEIFKFLSNNINENIVLDLYSGVGTLSIVAAKKAKKVYSLEIVENAVKDGIINSKLNNVSNIDFVCGNVNKTIKNINDKINTVIIDPPRSGLDIKTYESIINLKPEKIIYISCNPNTLMRDLKKFQEFYTFDNINIYDMFSYSEHCESICILKRSDYNANY